MNVTPLELQENLTMRGAAYKLLSVAFVPHDGRRLPELLAETLERTQSLAAGRGNAALASAASRLVERLSQLPRDVTELRSGASVIFGSPAPYPPYEGEYEMANIFMKTQTMADVAGFYRAFGLELSPGFKDRPDHLSAEFEFMHFLLVKEAHATKRGLADLARETRKAQARFLEDHLGFWGPNFLGAVASSGGNAFYSAVADFGRTFLQSELSRMQLSPRPAEIKEPNRELDPPAGCQLAPSS